MALTTKREKFVLGLVEGKSQRQAYKDAGYSVNGKSNEYVDRKASDLFKNGEVLGRYNELMGRLEDDCIMNAKDVLKEISSIAESNAADSDSFGARYRGTTKLKALEMLAKHYGLDKSIGEDEVEIAARDVKGALVKIRKAAKDYGNAD